MVLHTWHRYEQPPFRTSTNITQGQIGGYAANVKDQETQRNRGVDVALSQRYGGIGRLFGRRACQVEAHWRDATQNGADEEGKETGIRFGDQLAIGISPACRGASGENVCNSD